CDSAWLSASNDIPFSRPPSFIEILGLCDDNGHAILFNSVK
ncbi:1137_t:CDS:2, partial [Acaulospora colombiana]